MNPPPQNPPPSGQYGQYYRPTGHQGDPNRLEALADGYFGMNVAFVIVIVINLGLYILMRYMATVMGPSVVPLLVYLGFTFLNVALVSYPYNKKIAGGLGWGKGMEIIASLLMGIVAWLCCGILGFVVMQMIAADGIKRYGLKGSFFSGIKKQEVRAVIEQLRQQQNMPEAPSAGVTGSG